MKRIASPIVILTLASLPFATGTHAQSIVDFRQAVRTAEPSLVTVVVSPVIPGGQAPNRIGNDNPENDGRPKEQADERKDRAGDDGADPPGGPRIEWLDPTGKPLAQAPFQPGRAGADSATQEIRSAAFAVDESIIVAYVAGPAESVAIRDSDGNEARGDVIALDYVTGLAAIKVEKGSYPGLVVSAAQTEPGMPVIAAWMDDHVLKTDSGMVSTRPIASGSGIGLAPEVDFGSGAQMIGTPLLDSDAIVVGVLVPSRNGGLVCAESASILRLVNLATGDKPSDLKRGLIGIQFQGGGALVMDVSPDSPASEAGIKAGDLVESVDEVEVRDAMDVVAAVATARAGDTIDLVVNRGDKSLTVPIRLAEHPQQRLAMSLRSGTGRTIQNGFELKDGKLVPLEIDPNLTPFGPGMENFPMNEFFRRFQQPQGPAWRFQPPENQGLDDRFPIEGNDVEKTLKELQRQMEQLNQKLDQPE